MSALGKEADRGFNLGAHGTGWELAGFEVLLRFCDSEAIEPLLVGFAEVDRDAIDFGRDHEEAGTDLHGQQGRRSVLVDDGFNAGQLAVRRSRDGDAAAAGCDEEFAVACEAADELDFDDSLRLWRGHDAAKAATRVLDHSPAV